MFIDTPSGTEYNYLVLRETSERRDAHGSDDGRQKT